MKTTMVKEVMTKKPEIITPTATLEEAAKKMKDVGCGCLPVGDAPDAIEGILTDRDIVIRALAQGKVPAETLVRDFMTERVITCNEEDSLEEAADKMHVHQVSRLVVKDLNGQISGILSFGNILRRDPDFAELTNVVQHAVRSSARPTAS